MKLSSARDLKQQIRELYGSSQGHGGTGIAVGIATNHREYRVAVRVRVSLPAHVKAEIEKITRGEVDIRVTGEIKAWPAKEPIPRTPLAIGSSIGHCRSTGAGTLGFFAQRIADGAMGIVSNNHVLAIEDGGGEGDEILCPGPADHGESPGDVVAHLAGDYPRLQEKGPTADCAFARLVEGVPYDPLALGPEQRLSPTPAPADVPHDVVEKIGRTTKRTQGMVTAFDLDEIDMDYSFGTTRFNDSIEVESTNDGPFASGGDSGSLVFNSDRQPLGLVYACSFRGGARNNGLTYLNPINSVLSALRVTFPS